jgi:hypothetical protein
MVNGETWGFIMVKKHVLYIDDSWLFFFSGKKKHGKPAHPRTKWTFTAGKVDELNSGFDKMPWLITEGKHG